MRNFTSGGQQVFYSYETTHILVHAAIRKMSIGYSVDHEECERTNDSTNVVVVVHFKLNFELPA